MSIDYGRRRVGIAVGDTDGGAVKGLQTIDRKKKPDIINALMAQIDHEAPQRLIFGLPLDSDDADTVMSMEVRAFAAKLGNRSQRPVYFVDESNTSIRAAELMRFRKKKDRRDKGAVDRMAACLILDQYIREYGCTENADTA